jgi:hypothetical protein
MRRVRPSRVVAWVAAPTLLLAALTACASGGQATDEPLPVLNSLNGSKSDKTKSDDQPEVGDEVGIKKFVARLARGAERTKQGHLTFTMSGGAFRMTGSGDVDYSVQPADMSLDMQLFGA